MKYLQIYEKFDIKPDDETLYIFDFDDTLVDTPRFEDLAIEVLKENVTIKSMLKKSVNLIGKTLSDIKVENGRLFIPDHNQEINVNGNWVRRKSRVYLTSPDKFHYTDMSLPNSVLELSKLYNSVKNKAIVTGRCNSMKSKIKSTLQELGLELPKYGIHCYPTKESNGDKVAIWKSKTIVDIIKKNRFKKAKFYEDNPKWIKTVNIYVKKELPEIEWEAIKV